MPKEGGGTSGGLPRLCAHHPARSRCAAGQSIIKLPATEVPRRSDQTPWAPSIVGGRGVYGALRAITTLMFARHLAMRSVSVIARSPNGRLLIRNATSTVDARSEFETAPAGPGANGTAFDPPPRPVNSQRLSGGHRLAGPWRAQRVMPRRRQRRTVRLWLGRASRQGLPHRSWHGARQPAASPACHGSSHQSALRHRSNSSSQRFKCLRACASAWLMPSVFIDVSTALSQPTGKLRGADAKPLRRGSCPIRTCTRGSGAPVLRLEWLWVASPFNEAPIVIAVANQEDKRDASNHGQRDASHACRGQQQPRLRSCPDGGRSPSARALSRDRACRPVEADRQRGSLCCRGERLPRCHSQVLTRAKLEVLWAYVSFEHRHVFGGALAVASFANGERDAVTLLRQGKSAITRVGENISTTISALDEAKPLSSRTVTTRPVSVSDISAAPLA